MHFLGYLLIFSVYGLFLFRQIFILTVHCLYYVWEFRHPMLLMYLVILQILKVFNGVVFDLLLSIAAVAAAIHMYPFLLFQFLNDQLDVLHLPDVFDQGGDDLVLETQFIFNLLVFSLKSKHFMFKVANLKQVKVIVSYIILKEFLRLNVLSFACLLYIGFPLALLRCCIWVQLVLSYLAL